jgi:translocation and assembly module TamB
MGKEVGQDGGKTPGAGRRWPRRLGLVFGGLAGAVVVLWLALLTPWGLDGAAWVAERAITAGSGFSARIENVSGTLPFSLKVGRFALADAKGPWLVISDAAFSWSPAALLTGRVVIHEIAADVVRLRRAPDIPQSHRVPVTFEWPPRFPRLPPILLDRLAVTRLILDKELAGQAAVIGLSGRLAESGQGAAALTLAAKRLDGQAPLSLSVGAALNYADWRLAVKASLTDAPGGLVASALAGDDRTPFALEALGDGPLSAWKGRLSARLGAADLLVADLGLGIPLAKDARADFSLNLGLRPTPGLLPPFFDDFLGSRCRLVLAGRTGLADSALELSTLEVSGAFGSVSLSGTMDPEADALAASGVIDISDASRLATSALAGRLGAKFTVAGPLSRPSLSADATARGFRAGPVHLADGDIKASAQVVAPITNSFPGATLAAQGKLAGLAGPDGTTLAGQNLDFTAKGLLTSDWIVDVDQAALTGQGGTVTLGQVHIDGGNVRGRLAVSLADLAGAASLVGLRLTGGAAVAGDVTTAPDGHGTTSLAASFTRLAVPATASSLDASVAALLGPSPKLDLTAAFSAEGARLTELSLAGKGLTLAGTGGYTAASDSLDAKVNLDAPDLTLLTAALGQPCAGAAEAKLTISGPAVSPRLDVAAGAKRLRLGELALSEASLEASLADSARRPSGKATMAAVREGETARAEAAYSLTGSRLNLTGLKLAAPDATFAGEADIDTATGRVSGKLAGQAGNLAGLGRFVGLPLAGSLKLTASAAAGPGKGAAQSLTVDLSAANLRLPGLAAGSLTVNAALDDLSGAPRGKASLTGRGLEASGVSLAALSATASGDGRAMAVSAEAKGKLAGQTAVEASLRLSLPPAEAGKRRIAVQSLAGSLEGRKFSLAGPAAVTLGNDALRVEGVNLALDKAKITASGTLGPNEASGKATVDNFPLPLLGLFGLAGIDGTATASATLSGTPARPQIAAETRVSGLRLAAEQGKGLPSVSLWAKAACNGARLDVTAGLAGKNAKESKGGKASDVVTVTAGLPMRLSLDPFACDLPPSGALSGQIAADADLADFAGLLARVNTRIVGRLTADLALGGTLNAPAATGALALAANRLENADAGLVLTNVVLKADASGGRLTIANASGEDGRGGRFTLSGTVGIADPVNGPVDVKLALSHLRVVGLDIATAAADGTIAVTGTLSRLRASGNIVIGPADVNLPTSLPPDVAVIPVTYINDPAAPKKPAAKAAPPAVARHVDLDLKISLGQAVYVRGLGLESRWTGQIAVTGTAAAPIVIGRYAVDKGSLDLLGSMLEITKGELTFSGGTPPAPTFDVRAETTKDNVTAGIAITGDADAPVITLTSTPPLPRDEILSRLLFGQNAGSLSPIQAAQLAQAAASIYAGGTPTSILARTRRVLGLDQLSIVNGKTGGMTGSVLKAGKEIFKGVTVGVEQGMGAQSGAVSVEVQVTPNITVDSRVGVDNKQGVGVNWKWDY